MAKKTEIGEALFEMKAALEEERAAIDNKLALLDELMARAGGDIKAKPTKKLEAVLLGEKLKDAKTPKSGRAPRGENLEIGRKIFEVIAAQPGKKCKKAVFSHLIGGKVPSKYINAWNNSKEGEAKQIKVGGDNKRDADYSVA